MAGKKRGRPKGSKNKVQPGQIILSIEPVKKKVSPLKGRPTGRKLPAALAARKWKKGYAPNPKGINQTTKAREKGVGLDRITKAMTIRLGAKCDVPGLDDLTWAEAIAAALTRVATDAANRNIVNAAKELRESTEGKTPDNVNLNATLNQSEGEEAQNLLLGKLTK